MEKSRLNPMHSDASRSGGGAGGGGGAMVAFDGVERGTEGVETWSAKSAGRRRSRIPPLFSKESMLNRNTTAFWFGTLFLLIPFSFYFIGLGGRVEACNIEWSCNAGFEQFNVTTEKFCRGTTVCPAGTVWTGSACEAYTSCPDFLGHKTFTLDGTCSDVTNDINICLGFANRTATECVGYRVCPTPIPDGTSWGGTECVQSTMSCWTLFNFFPRLILVIVLGLLLPLVVMSINAGYLKCRGRKLAADTRSHRFGIMGLTHHLLSLSSYELFQLGISLVGCCSYIYFTLNVRVERIFVKEWGEEVVVYPMTVTQEGVFVFIFLEVFSVTSYMTDFLIRLFSMPHGKSLSFVFSFYGMVDLLCFSCVLFPQIIQKFNSDYSFFLMGGPLRFIRIRRAVQGLDAARGTKDISFGPLTITSRVAAIITLATNIVIYVFVSAAIVMLLEFPCPVIQDPDTCNDSFEVFYLVVYYIICTFSTVGYGDMFPSTDWGRMVVTVLIILMLVEVPIQINKLSEYFEGDSQLDEMQYTIDVLARDLRAKFGIPEPAPRSLTEGSSESGKDGAHVWAAKRMASASEEDLKRALEALGGRFTSKQQAARELTRRLLGAADAAVAHHDHSHSGLDGGINPVQRVAAAAGRRHSNAHK